MNKEMQMNSATNTRKRNNRYVANRNDCKKRKQFVLIPGMTGFLCTCNFHERGCITDAYRLLNLFADERSASDMNKVLRQRERDVLKYLQAFAITNVYFTFLL